MDAGRIQQIGAPEDIYNEPRNAFVADFIGESNIIDGIMRADGVVEIFNRKFQCLDSGFGKDEPVDVVIRPEDIDIVSPEQGQLTGTVTEVTFKGMHYDIIVDFQGFKWLIQTTDYHPEGETIGIIGGTGCGKSSLVSLISRLYDVTSGCVKVGGEDVRSSDLETLRNQVAVVLQKNVLFSGTVLENLRWGKEMGHTEEYREACRMACADEFVEHLPKGYDAWVERGGANFSGGQKQRLCIARALLKQPKVLILDDSTSAVDTATDARIRKALRTVIPGTTKIIIAQRISSVQDADRILVLDNGKVSGFDSHENLLKTNTIYQEIYEAQTKGGGDFDHA